jgi:alkylhydroperoxidase family enzyme
MLGRSIGISDEKLQHLGDDPLPAGVYSEAEAAIVRYAQRSTMAQRIDEATYQALTEHFTVQQIVEICLNVGLAQMTNRFNATFLPEVDDYILEANEHADRLTGTCPIHYPPMPA